MEGIKGSVDKLRHLTTKIRYRLNPEQKIVDFAERLPRDDFEDRTRVILEQKFPKAEERLITKLVKSIAFRCHHILYQRHHERTYRIDGQDDGCKQQALTFFVVESLWLDEFGYPIPPKADPCSMSAMCQICLQELQVVGNEDPMWWKKHVESDMEHYTCLSDDCENSLCYFKSFDSWLEHMNREHLYDWPRCTYAKKIEWRCRVSDNCSTSFDNEDLLKKHLVVNHLTDFDLTDLQLVVEKSKFTQLRDPNICPLCEESINDSEPVVQQSSAENDGSHKTVRQQPDGQQSILGALQNDENEGRRPATNPNSSIRPNEMDLRMAAHIANHLKSVSLLCLGGLEPKGEERQEEDSGADMFGVYM
ncbi:hypothetical protein CFAM422_010590 [Trichoderma lentiforme]|uniref:C2H2-type domain-containing protein n=1 Tax=Trichoderma lentiforme TaxID=1567552 RepID=A0A9P4X880_9HYPO|nr:hypothetical protein CFAM422_010590 [Trichoderma lentiforme]